MRRRPYGRRLLSALAGTTPAFSPGALRDSYTSQRDTPPPSISPTQSDPPRPPAAQGDATDLVAEQVQTARTMDDQWTKLATDGELATQNRGPAGRLSRLELDAWHTFLRAHARITRALETELLADQQLALASYDVLVQLAEAPGRRLRMTEFADVVLLSRSGVTRLVDRLERGGLVERVRDPDGRGVEVRLTQEGFDRLRVASGAYFSGVAAHFAAVLDPDELVAFARACEHLADAATPDIAKPDALRDKAR